MNPEEVPLEQTEQPSEEQNPLSQIRTYQGDVASAINRQQESLVSIQQTEAARRRASGAPTEHTGRQRTALLALGGVVLILLASFGGWYTYQEYLRRSAPPEPVIPESRLITATSENTISTATSTTRSELIKSLRDSAEGVTGGEIKHLVLETNGRITNIETFLRILESDAPSSLIRSLSPIFMFGVLGGEVPSSFLIIQVDSFENAYARMLSWESDLARDIGPIFPSADRLVNVTSPEFRDITNRNKDARVLFDSEDKEVLLYSFLNNDILIITDNLNTLHTVISRLTAESLVR